MATLWPKNPCPTHAEVLLVVGWHEGKPLFACPRCHPKLAIPNGKVPATYYLACTTTYDTNAGNVTYTWST